MPVPDSLEGLRAIHQDLVALSENRLANVEKLWADLEARIEEFRKLLDKPEKSDPSRKVLSSGIWLHSFLRNGVILN